MRDGPRESRLVAAVVAAVAVLAGATLVGLVALWPDDRPRAERTPGASAPLQAEVVGLRATPCRAPAARTCRLVVARLERGGDVRFTTGEAVTSVTPRIGDAIRVVRNEIPPGTPPGAADEFTMVDYERRAPLLWLGAIFVAAVLVLSRWRGIRALVGLGVSLVVVFAFVVPAILDDRSPLAVAIVGSFAVMLATISLAHGVGVKSLAAMLGTAASLLLTIGLAVLFVELAHLSGAGSDASALLVAGRQDLSLQGLVLAGMVIGALGVLDDVTVSQSSAVMALRRADPGMRFARLYREGLRVGQDHAAATVNTLVLAYVGASLPVLLIFSQSDRALGDAINTEVVAEQVVAMLVGSVGLLAAVPITTALAGALAVRMPARHLEGAAGGHVH